jgi:hypothetical protein
VRRKAFGDGMLTNFCVALAAAWTLFNLRSEPDWSIVWPMQLRHAFVWVSSIFSVASCDVPRPNVANQTSTASSASAVATPSADADSGEIAGVFELRCGCELKNVDRCSEHVLVDHRFLPLDLPAQANLGTMPFCGKKNLHAHISGKIVNERFVASTFRYEPAPMPK